MTNAADAIATLLVETGIRISLDFCAAPLSCCFEFLGAPGIQYHLASASKKKPLRQGRRDCSFSSHRAGRPTGPESAANVGADDVSEPFPGFALELHQLQLRKRGEVAGAGVNLDAGQQPAEFKVLDARGLLHDVRARQVVAALLQYLRQC